MDYNSDKENKWDDNAFQTFVQIADNTDFETVDKRIINSKQLRTNEYDKKFDTRIFFEPYARLAPAFRIGMTMGTGLVD